MWKEKDLIKIKKNLFFNFSPMELEKNFYELYMSFISSAIESYRKETILNPFPRYFMNGDVKDFGKYF